MVELLPLTKHMKLMKCLFASSIWNCWRQRRCTPWEL